MNKRLRTILQYIFLLALGFFLVWWSIHDLTQKDKSDIRQALNRARYWLIIPVFGILLLSHYVRAVRWRLLIEPMGYAPGKLNTFFAVMIGYLANQAFPRLGEVLKCTVLARYEKVPADKLVGTIILERLIDAITLLFIFGITLAIQPGLYGDIIDTFFNPSKDPEAKKKIPGYVFALIILALLIILLIVWMFRNKKKLSDLPLLFKKIGRRVWQGISAISHLKKRALFIFLTIALWSLYLLGGYIGFFAFQETQQYGIHEAFTVLSAGSVGMVATPGGIGAYPLIIEATMHKLYGLTPGLAVAFGWLLWLVQTGVILIGGLISFVAMPWYNKRKAVEKT